MSENITSLNFSPDGKTLSASSADGVVAVYDYQARDVLLQQMAHSEDAMSTSFSADGNTLVSVGLEGTRLRFWNLRTGEPTLSFHVEEHPIHSVSFSPDGKLIAVARWDGTARIWKIN